jgi:hypothetical protein
MAEQLELFNEEQMGEISPEFQEVGDTTQPTPPMIDQTEWCFQFFDNEPVVFGWTNDDTTSSNLVIELRPTMEDALTFSQNGMAFKIFPREMSEESKRLREEQRQQNAGQNQETEG